MRFASFQRRKFVFKPLQQGVIGYQDVGQCFVRSRPVHRCGFVFHHAKGPERVFLEQRPDVLGDGEGMHVPSLLMQLGHPCRRLPLDRKDLIGRKDEVVNWLEARMTELSPVANALAQFVKVSFE
jgi:hypothetical protein